MLFDLWNVSHNEYMEKVFHLYDFFHVVLHFHDGGILFDNIDKNTFFHQYGSIHVVLLYFYQKKLYHKIYKRMVFHL